jgi:hypothetical protein
LIAEYKVRHHLTATIPPGDVRVQRDPTTQAFGAECLLTVRQRHPRGVVGSAYEPRPLPERPRPSQLSFGIDLLA